MMRVIIWRQNAPPPPNTPPGAAIPILNEVAAAASRVPGAGEIYWGFGHGGMVTVSHYDNYAVADAILKDPAVRASVAKLLALGMGIAEDFFVTTPEQVAPFLPQQ
jgi:hypothetical protein